MKGIILAAGAGTRLYPASLPISKILLPIYDKPMIYYPLSVLMQAGIKDILVITNEADNDNFKKLLGNGSNLGINIQYKIQYKTKGIADAFIIAKDFIKNDKVMLILGDNIFYGKNLRLLLQNSIKEQNGATIFGYRVNDPERFGVVEFDGNKNVLSLEEKPLQPKSNYAVTGLYLYDENVYEYAKQLKPSARGELEITDLNKIYLKHNKLKAELLDESYSWLDTGTHTSMLEAGNFVFNIEKNTGEKIACLELIALKNKFVNKPELYNSIKEFGKKNNYYNYVQKRLSDKLTKQIS